MIGREDVLPVLTQIPVIPLSTQIRGLRWEVRLSAADGLASDCVLKPEWIKAVDRAAIGPWISTFPYARWTEITTAILDVLGLPLPPSAA